MTKRLKRSCQFCGRVHGSGKCWRQFQLRKELRQQHPDWSKKDVQAEVRRILGLTTLAERIAEYGDHHGPPESKD